MRIKMKKATTSIFVIALALLTATSVSAQKIEGFKHQSQICSADEFDRSQISVPASGKFDFRPVEAAFASVSEPPKNDSALATKNPFSTEKFAGAGEAKKNDFPSKFCPPAAKPIFPAKNDFPNPAKNNLPLPAKKYFPPSQTATGYVRPTPKERFKGYVLGVVGPYALLGTAAIAGITHYRDLPREWENDSRGYARRFASGLGIQAVRATTVYALDEAFRLDSNFYKSKRKKIGERIADPLISTYTARTPSGKRVFGFPRVVGNYAAMNVAYKTWYPERFGFKQAARDTAFSLGFDFGINLFREFSPWSK